MKKSPDKLVVLALFTLLPVTAAIQHPALATEAIIIGGGSDVLDSNNHFEDSILWIENVLTERDVSYRTYFNDGSKESPDTYYQTDELTRPLTSVFGNVAGTQRRFRNHGLGNIHGSTMVGDLEPALTKGLAENTDEELLLIHSGLGSFSGTGEDSASLKLWNDDRLSTSRLHQLLAQNERTVRYVFSHSYSGSFHRLAYRNPSQGLELNGTTHCGFTSNSAYSESEFSSEFSDASDYRDYLSYFFSALSGFEYDGQIISRFADLDEDGQTSLREAHLFTLEEAMSIDLPLSSSEDYLLRWQPWYLRWQPPQKQLPNNEYSQIFRHLAKRMDITVNDNVARGIRKEMATVTNRLQAIEQQRREQEASIKGLQSTIQSALISQWPTLAQPYTQDFEKLLKSDNFPAIETLIEQFQPEYEQLQSMQKDAQHVSRQHLGKRREAVQLQKLLRLRHLALIKQQLYEYGSEQQISDYRTLLLCEEAPLMPTTSTTVISEKTIQ
ncbi:MAG: hypothetical protein AB8B87_12640 [Granulosicoccus sp.]